MRLMVLIASTLVAFVKTAGATMNVSTANGFCVSKLLPMVASGKLTGLNTPI